MSYPPHRATAVTNLRSAVQNAVDNPTGRSAPREWSNRSVADDHEFVVRIVFRVGDPIHEEARPRVRRSARRRELAAARHVCSQR
jgi:hypothetical protein